MYEEPSVLGLVWKRTSECQQRLTLGVKNQREIGLLGAPGILGILGLSVAPGPCELY